MHVIWRRKTTTKLQRERERKTPTKQPIYWWCWKMKMWIPTIHEGPSQCWLRKCFAKVGVCAIFATMSNRACSFLFWHKKKLANVIIEPPVSSGGSSWWTNKWAKNQGIPLWQKLFYVPFFVSSLFFSLCFWFTSPMPIHFCPQYKQAPWKRPHFSGWIFFLLLSHRFQITH